jgi:F-type H+-transporting ATPase subunit beta
MKNQPTGKITQIISVVVDVHFDKHVPNIYNALEVKLKDDKKIVLEVASDLGNNTVRTIAMGSTDGLKRGMEVVDTGSPISVPVGLD